MKKLNILLFGLFLLAAFSACQKDEMLTINPLAESGDLTFHLNQTRYTNYTYILEEANNDLSMDALTCDQPDYGFTAAVTYYIQASFTEDMAEYSELATSIQGETVAINTKDMNKAMLALYQGTMPNPTVAKDVYVRLKAIVSTATPTPLDSVPIVKPVYSNVVKLNILPYFMEDLVSYDNAKKIIPWYVIGLGDGAWKNEVAGLGVSVFPMSVAPGNWFDSEGNGKFIFTSYIKADQGFKLIRDLGSWDAQWGNGGGDGINNPVFKDGGSGNFKVPESGYYNVILNSVTNEVKIEKVEITPTAYTKMGLIGAMTDWASDVEMAPFQADNNHLWYVEYKFGTDSQCKFRANGGWDVNWGTPSANDGDPLYSIFGLGVQGGKNMIETAGTYMVMFNDIDGFYYFYKK
ncbi:MAG: SusE domain-containing protein [Petrimonas sp.]|nr:SusE domain-containing protein [Petrimonas sp.]